MHDIFALRPKPEPATSRVYAYNEILPRALLAEHKARVHEAGRYTATARSFMLAAVQLTTSFMHAGSLNVDLRKAYAGEDNMFSDMCSCGYPKHYARPCAHALAALKLFPGHVRAFSALFRKHWHLAVLFRAFRVQLSEISLYHPGMRMRMYRKGYLEADGFKTLSSALLTGTPDEGEILLPPRWLQVIDVQVCTHIHAHSRTQA